ncbi:PHD and RING finger domain-containing protein 1 [Bienertia sinuspersici]
MGDLRHHTTDKPCEICGDIGWIAAIVICSKCKVTREHMYCMSIMYEGDREKWICDECNVSNKNPLSETAPSKQPSWKGARFMIKKPPQNTKVQYLAPEEIRVLESGAMRNNSSLNNRSMSTSLRDKNLSVSTGRKNSVLHCQHSPVAKQSSARVFKELSGMTQKETNGSARKHHRSPTAKHVTFEKFPKPGAKRSTLESEDTLELVQDLAAASSDKGAQQFCMDTPSAKCLPVEKLYKDDKNTEDSSQLVQSFPTASSVSDGIKFMRAGFDACAEAQPKSNDSKGRESPKVTLVFDSYLPNHPATSPTWKGTLKIMNDVLPCSSFDEIQAHPPCKVYSKAYKLSKQLPKTLYYEMLPRQNTWADLFKDYVPGELDIGLYFFHAMTSNVNGDYSSLLEYLDGHDLLLRTCINGVELFAFSSKHLPEASRVKHKFAVASGEAPVAMVDPVHSSLTESISKEFDAEDMDVDMIGGHEVGKVDVIIPKHKDRTCGDHKEGEKGGGNEIKASPMSTSGSVVDFSSIKIKKEWTDDTEISLPCTTSVLDNDREFEEELQRSFDRFTALMQLTDPGCLKMGIKEEVNA